MLIQENEIHLWVAYSDRIQNAHLFSEYDKLLNEKERLQHNRFIFEKDRHRFLITRAMVKSVLSLYEHEIAPQNWRFQNNQYGKPAISNRFLRIPLCFNISHTERVILMAVALDLEIGVDVEYLSKQRKIVEIANNFFTDREVEDLVNLPPEALRNRFFSLWTLKEAYIKACGMGFSIPLDHFSFSFNEEGEIEVDFLPERNDRSEYWNFWQIRPRCNHIASLAAKSVNVDMSFKISIREITPLSDFKEVSYPVSHNCIL